MSKLRQKINPNSYRSCIKEDCIHGNEILPPDMFPRGSGRRMCKECHKKRYQVYIKDNDIHTRKDTDKYWDCICPMCGEMHKKRMFWTGRSINPRIMCQQCKYLCNATEDLPESRIIF